MAAAPSSPERLRQPARRSGGAATRPGTTVATAGTSGARGEGATGHERRDANTAAIHEIDGESPSSGSSPTSSPSSSSSSSHDGRALASNAADERAPERHTPAGAESPVSDAEVKRDLDAIVGDGIAFSVMVGLGETYVPAFAVAAGLGELAAGLVATLPMVVGAICQLVTPTGVRRLGSHKRWVVTCARLQAASFIPLAFCALSGRASTLAVFAAVSLYWAFGMATTPAWNAWVGTLVPARARATFFARRAQLCHIALALALLAGGAVLDLGAAWARPAGAFGLIFALAGAARLLSARHLARQRATVIPAAESPPARGPLGLAALAGHGGAPLAFLLGMNLAVNLAAPFFTPYLLGHLKYSYAAYTTLIGASLLARIAMLPLLGRLAHRLGTRPLLVFGALGVVPLPTLWLVSDSFVYLLGLQVLSGCVWAAFELATLLTFFDGIDPAHRTRVLTSFNFVYALAVAAGSLFGSAVFRWVEADVAGAGYAALFLCSAGLRVACLPLLRSVGTVMPAQPVVVLRTLAVRPAAGAIQRPVLSALAGAIRR